MNTLQMGILQFKERSFFDLRIQSISALWPLVLGLMLFSNPVQAAPLVLKDHYGANEFCDPYWGSDEVRTTVSTVDVNVGEGFSPGLYSVFWETGDGPSVAINVAPGGTHSISGGPNTVNATQVQQFVNAHGRPPNLIVVPPAQYPHALMSLQADTLTRQEACDCTTSCGVSIPSHAILTLGSTYYKCTDDMLGGDGGCGSGGCGSSESKAMARYSVHSMLASLNIRDTPIGYSPPRGEAINFTVTYNQRETQQPGSHSNLGPNWTFNWLSYVKDNPTNPSSSVSVYLQGGGIEIFPYDINSNTFAPDPQSHAMLVRDTNDPNRYERRLPDGSKQVFCLSDEATTYPRKIFMTSMVDQAGNIVSIEYDASFRVTKIRDALCSPQPSPGQCQVQTSCDEHTTIIAYDNPNDLKIRTVTDPYGRLASFEYYLDGKLWKITDQIGMQSEVHYAPGTTTIDWLKTPYGTTHFDSDTLHSTNSTNRWVEITDPEGGKERVEFRDWAPNIAPSDLVAPNVAGIVNDNLDSANTFYWDKKAMSEATTNPPPYTTARIKHWLYNTPGGVSGILSSEKRPLENRVWYSYPAQPSYQHVGSSASPDKVARVLDDNTTQLWQYEYNNSMGKMTKAIDPVGRVTTYVYHPNDIDVWKVQQKNGAIDEVISEFQEYVLHRPKKEFDASRQLTVYDYNDFGQILSITNPKNEITVYEYDHSGNNGKTDGYLERTKVTGPGLNGAYAITHFGYDEYKRINSVRDEANSNYTVTTEFDLLDRKTRVTYQDGTNEAFEYLQDFGIDPNNRILDLTTSWDRLGRPTIRQYNRNRQIVSITEPPTQQGDTNPRITSYGWCLCGSLNTITDPDGNVTTFGRDLQSRVTSKEFADHKMINYVYENTTSRLASMTDALNQTTFYEYYPDDNLKHVGYFNAHHPTPSVHYVYDNSYNRIASITSGNQTIAYTYYPVTGSQVTGAGKVHTVDGVFPNDTITYDYDQLGREVSQSINNGVGSSVHFDSLGRTDSSTNALGTFVYTPVGLSKRIESVSYPNNQVSVTYGYFSPQDGDLRLRQIQNVGGSNLSTFDYTYYDDGQIKSWAKNLSEVFLFNVPTLWFDYDSWKRLKSAHDAEDYSASTYALDFDYDLAGNRTRDFAHDPQGPADGILHEYVINEVNQVTTQYTTIHYQPTTQASLIYDRNGNLTDDGLGKTYEWDAANRLVAINYAETGARTEFAYDGLGRRVKIIEHGPGFMATVQPQGADYSIFDTAPSILPAGDYTLKFEGMGKSGTAVALIDSVTLNNTLVPNGGFETPNVSSAPGGFEYNPNGANWSFTGTAGITANGGDLTIDNPDAPEGSQSGFVQNQGVISQTWTVPAGTYVLSFRAAQSKSVNQHDEPVKVTFRPSVGGMKVKTFVWCGNQICEERDDTGTTVTKRFFAQGEERIGTDDAGDYFYTRDHLGSVREVTDSTGGVVAQFDYDPYGNRVVVRGKMDFDFGYTGHYYHAQSGLNLTLYRAYDPKLGRWISRDPIGEQGGTNLYAYVGNNAVNLIDALGLCCDRQKIAEGRATLEANFQRAIQATNAMLAQHGITVAGASCIDKNIFGIYQHLGPIPKCWECNVEYRIANEFSYTDYPDHWAVVCFGKDDAGNVKDTRVFDYWAGNTSSSTHLSLKLNYPVQLEPDPKIMKALTPPQHVP